MLRFVLKSEFFCIIETSKLVAAYTLDLREVSRPRLCCLGLFVGFRVTDTAWKKGLLWSYPESEMPQSWEGLSVDFPSELLEFKMDFRVSSWSWGWVFFICHYIWSDIFCLIKCTVAWNHSLFFLFMYSRKGWMPLKLFTWSTAWKERDKKAWVDLPVSPPHLQPGLRAAIFTKHTAASWAAGSALFSPLWVHRDPGWQHSWLHSRSSLLRLLMDVSSRLGKLQASHAKANICLVSRVQEHSMQSSQQWHPDEPSF